MFSSDVRLPVMPAFAVRETNWDTLLRLGRDLTLVGNHQLSAADSYRFYWYDEQDRGTWGCGVEAARAFMPYVVSYVRIQGDAIRGIPYMMS